VSAREAMLGRIRRSLGVSGADVERRAAVADRLMRAPRGVVPARAQLPADEKLALFVQMARAASAEVEMIDAADIASTIAHYLAERQLPAALKTGSDPRLARIDWSQSALDVRSGEASADDMATLSHGEVGVAETGSLLLVSGAENPTLLNFLPLAHIVLLNERDIVGDAETALERLQAMFGKGRMPRLVNFITGPSRSGDIEQTMYLGAHGPRYLLVLVVRP